MKWPWVSREAYEERERSLMFAHREIERLRKRVDELLDEAWNAKHPLVERGDGSAERLLRDGGHEIVVTTPARPVDPVRQVIREQVRANKGMAGLDGYLWDYARQLRDERNMSPNEIAAALLKWDSSETLSEPVDSVVPIVGEDAA